MKDGMKKEISQVRDKRTKRQTRQSRSVWTRGEGGEGMRKLFWKYRSKSNYVKHYKTN
jgi:hypothetical protein